LWADDWPGDWLDDCKGAGEGIFGRLAATSAGATTSTALREIGAALDFACGFLAQGMGIVWI
jgi:hypothetical protein